MCGIYELPDKYIKVDLDLTLPELTTIKEKFQKDGKIIFANGWIKLVNHDKFNSYGKGERQLVAYEREVACIPTFFDGIDTSIDTSMHTHGILDIIHKSKIIIPKSEIQNSTNGNIVLEKYNTVFRKNLTSTVSFEKNLTFWLTQYSIEDIIKAIELAPKHRFYGDKLTPEMLFRRRGTNGEDTDRIAELLSLVSRPKNKYDSLGNVIGGDDK